MGRPPAAGLVNPAPRPGTPSVLARPDLDPVLARRADRRGVATWYLDQAGRPVAVAADTITAVLDAMDEEPSGPPPPLPPVVVSRAGTTTAVGLAGSAAPRHARVVLADGSKRPVPVQRGGVGHVAVLPGSLPVGWHRLVVEAGGETMETPVAVAPYRLPVPPRMWGWAIQLYATRSTRCWGVGDFGDLRNFAVHAATQNGADFVVVNPLGAVAPTVPIEASPYTPASRRFVNPLYLRIEETLAYRQAPEPVKARVNRLRPATDPNLVDRDLTWSAMEPALRLLWSESARPDLDRARAERPGLESFARWCAIAAEHGRDFRRWPAELRDPAGPAVAALARARRAEVDFHTWLQLLAEEQLTRAQAEARAAGMAVGLIHDLPVGVDGGGADAWAMQRMLAGAVTTGAPPDEFNQRGQDWGLPPWRPHALREAAYEPFRQMVGAVLGNGGGIRVDHVMGLFRLWWIPAGRSPAEGTYVRYRADELLGVLALEAHRAGGVVVGEDLGTVEPRVGRELAARGVLGTAVLWFEKEGERNKPFRYWRRDALAAITTHDLPTAAGFLAGEHVRIRAELGQLRRPVQEERAAARREREQLVALLESEGLAEPGASDEELVRAMHAGLARSPARLVGANLADAVGDRRQPNLPGTTIEYPNWKLPVAEPEPGEGERPLMLDELLDHRGVLALARILTEGIAAGSDNVPGDRAPEQAEEID